MDDLEIQSRITSLQESKRITSAVEAILNEVNLGEIFQFIQLGVMESVDQGPLLTAIWSVPNADDLSTTMKFRAVTEIMVKPEDSDFVPTIHKTCRALVFHVLAHELHEFYQYQGKRVFEPHPTGNVSPFIIRWMMIPIP